jgi:hypothetical protein
MGFMAALAPVIGLIGTGVSAIGAIGAGQQQRAAANYQSQVALNNQTIAYQNANYAAAAGETQSYNQGLKQRSTAGAIRATIGAGGIDVNTGSAAKVQESQQELGLQDVEQVRQNAALQTYGYRTQASNFGAQSTLDTAEGKFDAEAGWLKGIGGLVSGVSKFGPGSFPSIFDSTDPNTGWQYSAEKAFLPAG